MYVMTESGLRYIPRDAIEAVVRDLYLIIHHGGLAERLAEPKTESEALEGGD